MITSIIVACRIGSAFAAELGTMQVSEQIGTLRVLGTDQVDYLVTPRVIASCVALPFLTLIYFTVGLASIALLADGVYRISINIILDSAQRALRSWDIISAMIKSQVFGLIISVVSCGWGFLLWVVLKVVESLLLLMWFFHLSVSFPGSGFCLGCTCILISKLNPAGHRYQCGVLGEKRVKHAGLILLMFLFGSV